MQAYITKYTHKQISLFLAIICYHKNKITWSYWRNLSQDAIESSVNPRLLQPYSQCPSFGNNSEAPQLMTTLREYSMYTQWSVVQL
jgi:ABC-type uncharacterized transport system permease subunit